MHIHSTINKNADSRTGFKACCLQPHRGLPKREFLIQILDTDVNLRKFHAEGEPKKISPISIAQKRILFFLSETQPALLHYISEKIAAKGILLLMFFNLNTLINHLDFQKARIPISLSLRIGSHLSSHGHRLADIVRQTINASRGLHISRSATNNYKTFKVYMCVKQAR